jgi:hypothetical protein
MHEEMRPAEWQCHPSALSLRGRLGVPLSLAVRFGGVLGLGALVSADEERAGLFIFSGLHPMEYLGGKPDRLNRMLLNQGSIE